MPYRNDEIEITTELRKILLDPGSGLSRAVQCKIRGGQKAVKLGNLVKICRRMGLAAADARLDSPDDVIRLEEALRRDLTAGNDALKYGLDRIPQAPRTLVGCGHKRALEQLDNFWESANVRVVTIAALLGGIGKSSLVSCWLRLMKERGWRGAACILAWSFSNQQHGSSHQTSGDEFIDSALDWLHAEHSSKNRWDRGTLLARLIKQERTLLVLDGLEPLQFPPGHERSHELEDEGVVALLNGLAQGGGENGLCIITTRLHVAQLDRFERDAEVPSARIIELAPLSDEDGAELLRFQNVVGSPDEMRNASREYGGHPLALKLLATYLKSCSQGRVESRVSMPELPDAILRRLKDAGNLDARHLYRMMVLYDLWYRDKAEMQLIKLLSLFDRQAEREAVQAMLEPPVIEELTDRLQNGWGEVAENLHNTGFVDLVRKDGHGVVNMHPLIREYFAGQLREHNIEVWRDGHRRLFQYFQALAPDVPATLQQLIPLYRAVRHGCQAGEYASAFKVYWTRIAQGDRVFGMSELGVYGEELSALAGFFRHRWDETVEGLDGHMQGMVLGTAAFSLRAIGCLTQSLGSMTLSEELLEAAGDLQHASQVAGYHAETLRTLGRLAEAVVVAERCVEVADRSDHLGMKIYGRTTLGDVLHRLGEVDASLHMFREAEQLFGRQLDSIPGARYCELLFSCDRYDDVIRQADAALRSHDTQAHLLAYGYCLLYKGLSQLRQDDSKMALECILRAEECIRKAGLQEHQAFALVLVADVRRRQAEFIEAERNLDEAGIIARSCSANLVLADVHLSSVRLYLDWHARTKREVLLSKAVAEVNAARDLVGSSGYQLRLRDVQDLETLVHRAAGSF